MLINDLTLLLDLFGNSEGTKLLIWTVIFCLVCTAPEKWRWNSGKKPATIVTDACKICTKDGKVILKFNSESICYDQLNGGFIPIFCYTDSYYVQTANEPIVHREDAHIRTYLLDSTDVTKQEIWNFLRIMKWEGMPRGDFPLSEQKSKKLV